MRVDHRVCYERKLDSHVQRYSNGERVMGRSGVGCTHAVPSGDTARRGCGDEHR